MKNLLCLFALIAVGSALVLPIQQDNGLNCLMCEVGVRAAEDPADREAHTVENVSCSLLKTQENVLFQKFDAECKKELGFLPFAEKQCENYGNSKLDPIINELEGGTAPEDVCRKLKECPSN